MYRVVTEEVVEISSFGKGVSKNEDVRRWTILESEFSSMLSSRRDLRLGFRAPSSRVSDALVSGVLVVV